jgi:hypothetical protein
MKSTRWSRQKAVEDNWKQRKQPAMIVSSAAEYLTFVAATGDNPASVEMRYQDENIWLTQKMMAELYGVSVAAINQHLKTLYNDGEMSEATIKKYLIVQNEGVRQVQREIDHYNLQAIIAVGFKIENQRAVQFRKWAAEIVKNYTIQGWVMDVPRLKNGHLLTDTFFERQLAIIREIRLSERKFYQKVTDIYAMAIDYDKNSKITRDFFATVQNKLHFAIHGQTAAEIIMTRADASKRYMGLTTWEGAPDGKIQKPDVSIGKNYLTDQEIGELERIVSAYLDLAELQAMRHQPMTMEDWEKYLSRFLKLSRREMFNGKGRVSAQEAKEFAETQWEKYRIVQDRLFESDFDRFLRLTEETNKLKVHNEKN